MFSKLYTRYMRFLLPCVTLIFTCYGLVSFLAFVRLLQTDYIDKISFFTEQQTANGADYLRLAEHSMNLFLLQNDPTDPGLNSNQAYNNLRKIKSISLDVSAAFLVNSSSLYINPLDSGDLLSGLRAQRDRFCIPDGEFKWYYLECGHITTDMLLCTKTIPDFKQEPFTLGVLIPAEKILPNVSGDAKSTGIFSSRSFSASIQCEPDAFLSLSDGAETNDGTPPVENGWKYDIAAKEIEGSPFTLRLAISREKLTSRFVLFFFEILALCAALFFAAYFALRRFLRRLTGTLESLCVRFSDFSELGDPARESTGSAKAPQQHT